jgi:sialic acid synthase SpsE
MEKLITVIGDPGSCHLGDFERARKLIDVGKDTGLDAVKFQLFPESMASPGGNCHLPYEWFEDLVRYGESKGIEVFASVFDTAAYRTAARAKVKSMKFSFKSPMDAWVQTAVDASIKVYWSGDVMNRPPKGVISLYCIPEYPIRYMVDYDCLFEIFDGFSDHTLGYAQTLNAVKAGAKVIEKHYCLGDEAGRCPDSLFALEPARLHAMISSIRFRVST